MIDKAKAQELADYFGKPLTEIIIQFRSITDSPSFINWVKHSVDDWNARSIDQSSRKQVEAWFKETDQYIFELMEVQSAPLRKQLNKRVLNLYKKYKVRSVLDFGGGVGQNSIEAARAGFKATLADLPSKTLEFAKWRIRNQSLPVKIIEVKNDVPLKAKYDAITCFEVFQHLLRPLKVAKHLAKHLKKGGVLMITIRFHNPKYKMALIKNYKYENTFDTHLQNLGLKRKEKNHLWGKDKAAKYLYIYQKP